MKLFQSIESIHIYRSRSGDADPGAASIHFKEYGYVQHVNSFEDAIGKLVEYFTTAEGAPLAGRLAVPPSPQLPRMQLG